MSGETNPTSTAEPETAPAAESKLAPHLVELYDPRSGKTYTTLRGNFDPAKHVRAEHKEAFLRWCRGDGDWPPGSGGNVREEAVDPSKVTFPLPVSAAPRADASGGAPSEKPSKVEGAVEETSGQPGEGVQEGDSEGEDDTPPTRKGKGIFGR